MGDTDGVEVLMVEDSEEDLQLTLRSFKKANFLNRVHVARDASGVVAHLVELGFPLS